ncbi:SAM-dependent methyltransferase [Streptomyces sp. NPDC020731]|uniref:SAM-dependent methyltransferase n=1 Tax=Streptomyces sp. NPDC020731 TaxID=3365085 RepID=UPI0037AF6B28
MTSTPWTATSGANTIGSVARTALWTAAARARESSRPDRLFTDPLAARLAGREGPELLRHFHTRHAADEGNPFLAVRTRWFDDFLTAPDGPDVRQVVGLGAGLDARAIRLSWHEGTTLFEVDQADLLAYKEERLRESGLRARCARRVVPADLAGDWVSALLDAGYRPDEPSVWFAEGVLFYLPERLAHSVLEQVGTVCAPGTRLAVDLIGTGVFRLPYTREFLDRLAEAGSPWQFGTDDPAGFLSGCGWHVDVVTEPGFPDAAYGRWPRRANPADLPGLPRSYLAAAHLPDAG